MLPKRCDHKGFQALRHDILGGYLDNARSFCIGKGQQCAKIQIMRKNSVSTLTRPVHNELIGGPWVPNV